ncbi:hypothetical protein QMK19_34175 [Streptomyces sp. H10-C2]|uniref:hypothetical protein n=1 Tax=unclassified Streptomyces TaxID=2593676 RepID=UPI0024BAC137|nr:MULTISPECIES: hypothetical protein [unclassified Streptomyces]MDJ0345684.1 hypothetical protein [Streptomyces sp. PH10-H1]MDJ0374536.1 hypothetical protein [Streptomyces sp. H10-C2]
MPAWCPWCKVEVSEDDRIMVGVVEVASGPGRPVYACDACKVAYRIVAFADHLTDTDGNPRYTDREPFAPWSRHA